MSPPALLLLLLALGLERVLATCQCRDNTVQGDGRVVGQCKQSKDFFERDHNGELVLDSEGLVVLNDRYFCSVEAGSTCSDKSLDPASQELISHEACQYFVPPPGYSDKASSPVSGCGGPGLSGLSWRPFRGGCYMLVRERLTWHQAEKKCNKHLGHLVSISSTEEEEFIVKELLDGTSSRFWVGGKAGGDGGDFSWTDGTSWTSRTQPPLSVRRHGGNFRSATGQAQSGPVKPILTHDGDLNTAISLQDKMKIIQIVLNSIGVTNPIPVSGGGEAQTVGPVATDLCVQGSSPWSAGSCQEQLYSICEY